MKRILLSLLFTLYFVSNGLCQWVSQPTGLAANVKIKALSVVDQNIVWAYTDLSVLRTTNGGATWTNEPINIFAPNSLPYRIHSLHAVNATTAYIIANLYLGHGSNIRIYKTTDGGVSWQRQATAYPNESRIGTVSIADFIYFFDPNNGVIFGDQDSGYFEIYTTTDGGQNWSRVPAANLPPPALEDLSSPGRLYATMGDTLWVGVSGMRVYRSINKGLNWTVANTGITPVSGALRPMIRSISFTDALNGLVIYSHNQATNTVLYRTNDGGLTWANVTYTGPIGKTDIEAIPGLMGAYISTGGEFNLPGSSYSLDNGNSWFPIENTLNHYDIEFYNNTLGWTTSDGVLFKYTGGPLSLSTMSQPDSFFRVFPNPSSGLFFINSGVTKPFNLSVFNALGQKVTEVHTISEPEVRLNLSGLKKGNYFLHLWSGRQKTIKMISIQ